MYSNVILLYIEIYLFFFKFFSLLDYYKILSIVPCAIQQVLVNYLFYISLSLYMIYIYIYVCVCVCVNPKLLIILPPAFPFGNHKFVFYVCGSISVL